MPSIAEINIEQFRRVVDQCSAADSNDFVQLLICAMERGHPVGLNATTEIALGKSSPQVLEKAIERMEKKGLVKKLDNSVQIVNYPEIVKRVR